MKVLKYRKREKRRKEAGCVIINLEKRECGLLSTELEERWHYGKAQTGKVGYHGRSAGAGRQCVRWTVTEPAAFSILDAFVAAGFELIDTADVYSRWVPGNRGGESETIIGNWMRERGNRRKVVIATKVGSEMGPGLQGLSRDHILRAVEASLRRLQTDHIDLYQSHRDDPAAPSKKRSRRTSS